MPTNIGGLAILFSVALFAPAHAASSASAGNPYQDPGRMLGQQCRMSCGIVPTSDAPPFLIEKVTPQMHYCFDKCVALKSHGNH